MFNPVWIEDGERLIFEGYNSGGDDRELFIIYSKGSSKPVAITNNSSAEYRKNLPK